MGWSWANGTPRERANMVRAHHRPELRLSFDDLRELFNLTTNGLHKILRGDDWRPHYRQRPVRPRRPKPQRTTYVKPDGTEMVEIAPGTDMFVSRASFERMKASKDKSE